MNDLLALNQKAIFDKIKQIRQIQNKYFVCNDFIDRLSETPGRDKALINTYTGNEIILFKLKRRGGLRVVRCFTLAGINKFIHEGNLYSYTNVCKYFNVEPLDKKKIKELDTLKKCLVIEQQHNVDPSQQNQIVDPMPHPINPSQQSYNVKKLLRWTFQKRKSVVSLGQEIKLFEYIRWLKEQITEYIECVANELANNNGQSDANELVNNDERLDANELVNNDERLDANELAVAYDIVDIMDTSEQVDMIHSDKKQDIQLLQYKLSLLEEVNCAVIR